MRRISSAVLAQILIATVALLGGQLASAAAATLRPYVAVSGNHLVNASGATIRLLGVDRSGAEYMCLGGSGVFDGPINGKAVKAMAAGTSTRSASRSTRTAGSGSTASAREVGGTVYQRAIKRYVQTLQARGLVAILDLHWAAPGGHLANSQWPMADADHAPAFWSSLAKTFKSNHGVIFDLFNEPYISSWPCWLEGCTTSYEDAGTNVSFQTAGMQALVDAVRATGARNVIMLGGLQWSSDESDRLKYEPSDPAHQLAVSFHTYNFSGRSEASCWNSTIAPLAGKGPGDHR